MGFGDIFGKKGAGNAWMSMGSGGLLGDNPVSKALGLNGAQGEYFTGQNANPAAGALADRAGMFNDAGINNMLNAYGTGKQSLADALTQERDRVGDRSTAQQQSEFTNELATNPLTGTRFATDQINGNDILGKLYGSGQDSALSRAMSQEKDLSTRGFSLQPEDYEAYGQSSGNIARTFGQSENNLSQALADRGMAAAPSGAAGVNFTGLAGNKNEQLARSQMDIANQRMEMNQKRLAQAQSFLGTMGGQANSAVDQQYKRQLDGVKQQHAGLENAAKAITAQNDSANGTGLASMQDKRGAAGKTLFGAIGNGLYNGVEGGTAKGTTGMMGGM